MSGKLPVDCFEMAAKDFCAYTKDQTQANLLNAWRDKDLDAFLKVLKTGDCDPDFLYESDNYMSLLDSAAENGSVKFAEAILKAGANVNLINPMRSKTPLHLAAEAGHLDMLKLLIGEGADVNIQDSTGSTVLHYMVKEKWQPNDTKYKNCLEYLLTLEELNLNVANRKNLTALHLATLQGCLEAVKMLLEKGSLLDVDTIKVGSSKRTTREEILYKFPQDIKEEDLPAPRNIYDIKMDGNKLFCLLHDNYEDRFCEKFEEEMKDKAQKSLLNYTDGRHTFLQSCCEKGFIKAANVLLEHGADVNYAPNLSTRPILIACRKGNCDLLRSLFNASPDLTANEDGENPLHVVVKYTENSEDHFRCLEFLLRRLKKADINAQDLKGNTPLHYAVKYGGARCVEELLKHGAYIGTLNKFEKPPLAEMAPSVLESYLDSCLTATDVLDRGNNYVMKFNYNFLVPKSQKYGSDREDVKIPLTEEVEPVTGNSEWAPECLPLLYMSKDRQLRKLLTHPVLTSFILLKWQRVSMLYYLNLLFYVLFCLLLTIYILFGYRTAVIVEASVDQPVTESDHNRTIKIAHDKYAGAVEHTSESIIITTTEGTLGNGSAIDIVLKESAGVDFLRICLLVFLAILTLRELFQAVIGFKKYRQDRENWLEFALLIVLAFVFLKDCSREFPNSSFLALWCPQFSALAILLSWFELVLLVGKHPMQSLHIEMFKTVSVNFIKFLRWYAILIMAFALTFFTLFRGCTGDCRKQNPFTDPGLAIFKSIVMLTGEFDASDIPFITFIGTSHLIFIAFIFLIAIVLLNLLNGLAVTDTQTIRNEAYLYRCIAMVKLISYFEEKLLVDPNPFSCFKCYNIFGKKQTDVGGLNCFNYFSKKITFFPKLLTDGAIYVLPNQGYKIHFSDPKTAKDEDTSCDCRLNNYYLDTATAKMAEVIVKQSLTPKDNTTVELEGLKKEIAAYGTKMTDLEKKIESLEQSTKQNEKLLIQILAILSLNNANSEERRVLIQ